MPDLRRQHRIAYQTNIRLRPHGRDQSVVARVQNLSASGMFITGSEVPAAGTEVQCRMVLGGQRRSLRGRVAWVKQSPRPTESAEAQSGAGIEFVELGSVDTDLLRTLTDPSLQNEEKRLVDVWFEGMKSPTKSHAVIGGDSVKIATKLPFLRIGSSVRIGMGDDGNRQGILESISLDETGPDGIPQLCLHVLTAEREAVGGIIDTPDPDRHRGDPTLRDEDSTVVDPDVLIPQATAEPDLANGHPPMTLRRVPVADRDRTYRIDKPLIVTELTERRQASDRRATVRRTNRALRWMIPRNIRSTVIGFLLGAAIVFLVGIGGRWLRSRTEPPAPRPLAKAAIVQAAPVAAPVTPVRAPAAAPAPVAAPPVAEPIAAETAPQPATPLSRTPEGFWVGTGAEGQPLLEVPMTGSLRGARHYTLADPPGLGVTLPNARTRVAPGIYRPSAVLEQIWVRPQRRGTNLRFFFNPRKHTARLVLEGDRVKLIVAPKTK